MTMKHKLDLDEDESVPTQEEILEELASLPEVDKHSQKLNFGTYIPVQGGIKPIDAVTKLDLIEWSKTVLPYSGEPLDHFLTSLTNKFDLDTLRGKERFFETIVIMHSDRAILGTGPKYIPEDIRSN